MGAAPPPISSQYISDLRHFFSHTRPTPPCLSQTRRVFVSEDLLTCSHTICHGAVKDPLTPAYDGPFQVLACRPKPFTLLVNGRQDFIAIDHVIPAYLDDPPKELSLAAPPSCNPLTRKHVSWEALPAADFVTVRVAP